MLPWRLSCWLNQFFYFPSYYAASFTVLLSGISNSLLFLPFLIA
jgi:hypothetical protein